jgi:glyoxylase-like metal-dependent hydrolase (beta-lactamase superfamily II)
LTAFRQSYVRGYPVFDSKEEERDSISQPTAVPLINQVTPHLYKLSHKTQGKNFAIIISDNGRGLILDAGLFPKAMLEEIIVGLRAHMGLKQIDAFWISHMHGDHFLLGPELKEKYGAKAWTLDRIADKCEFPRRYDYAALVSAYGDGFDGMKIDKPFRDGESIEWEGYKIQVDWMPGQTEFGCCLWLELDGKRIAFTGDNLFGNPADKKQNGHEAVVARNSAIFEEGYLLGSKYLKNLKPDIVMGSHSFVMHDPAEFIGRYHEWSKKIIQHYRDLLPDTDYEFLFDPYWVSAYPYRVDFSQHDTQQVTVTVRNFRDQPQRHRIELKLPAGLTANPRVLEGIIDRKGRQGYPVKLTVDRNAVPSGVQIVPFDITLDGNRHGELFDFLIRAND